jgi:hypothetical protein
MEFSKPRRSGAALQPTDLGEVAARRVVVGPDVRIVHSLRCLLTTKQTVGSHQPVAVLCLAGFEKIIRKTTQPRVMSIDLERTLDLRKQEAMKVIYRLRPWSISTSSVSGPNVSLLNINLNSRSNVQVRSRTNRSLQSPKRFPLTSFGMTGVTANCRSHF